MKLNELRDNPGATHAKKRVGRGIGSGIGKTCGHGVKGQKARTGVSINGFEGGQTPLYRRLPKRGFTNIFRIEYAEITLGALQSFVDAGRLDKTVPVTEDLLREKRIVRSRSNPVKLLGTGTLSVPLTVELSAATKSAADAVAKAGGSFKPVSPKASS